MPQDPNATQDPAAEPAEDTPPDGGQDTAPDTQQGTVDWESRYKELQKHTSKQIDQMQRQLDASSPEDDDEPDDDQDDEPDEPAKPTDRGAARLERDSWNLAEQVYGPDSLKAYGKAQRILDRAQTPADYVAAFEAYHEARLAGAKPAPQAPAPEQGDQAPPTRIESNRPDAGPSQTELDQKEEAAMAGKDLKGLLAARLQRIGVR